MSAVSSGWPPRACCRASRASRSRTGSAASSSAAARAFCSSPTTCRRATSSPGWRRRFASERADVLLAIDEEGGDVTRLEWQEGSSYPSAAGLGVVGDVELTEAVAAAIGAELAATGVNWNFAPVADVNVPENPVIGVRAFGDSAGRRRAAGGCVRARPAARRASQRAPSTSRGTEQRRWTRISSFPS